MPANLETNKYGLLLTDDIKLHRMWFSELLKLIGINVIYRAPRQDKHWTTYAEIESNYQEPLLTGCLFEEHPDQRTMKKLGWTSELQSASSIISVPYDLPDIQVGALFIVPSGIDYAQGRLFRVTTISTIIVYPSSVTCEIVPEYVDNYNVALEDFSKSSFNLLNEEGDGLL